MTTSPSAPVLAVDIGGTKLAAALVSRSGEVLRRAVTPTPATAGTEAVTAALLNLVGEVTAGEKPAGVGVGSAGPIDPAAGTVSPVNIPAWRDYPLIDRIKAAVPGPPVVLLGDAVAMAVGEHWAGAGRDSTALLGIVVSTGIGGGLVLDGRPYQGPTGNAGFIGHVVADPAGPPCACGGRGCVEAVASGPAMTRWALSQGWRSAADRPGARELAQDAESGDEIARAAFDRGAAALAAGIVAAAAVCDLDQVVVGGGVAGAGETLLGPLRRHVLDRTHLGFMRRLTVTRGALGGDAGLIGAARVAMRASTTMEYL
jgi:glucokinase